YGNVGRQLIDVITQNGKAINIAGICNTRNRYMCKKGVDVSKNAEVLGAKSDRRTSVNDFINDAIEMRLPNSVLVDCTSDKALANFYPGILSSGIGVVTCNKIANSQDMALYHRIRAAARGGKVPFYYDTNVGAALPILKTISLLQSSGDKVEKIEAIVSGTLNYIFSEYCKEGCKDSFEAIVRRSKELGYAEPDPRTDLQGTDVLRKAIIMAREAGAEIEESDIKIEGFLPEECLSGDVESFFEALKRNEDYFSGLRKKAFDAGAKLRYVAKIEGNDVVIGLMEIDAAHPFYNCEGTDAAVSLSTKLYPTPIFIKGAGAGARITAEGVYGNICECR
ncbi:MAG: bifunctional aspartate kinase/homoserine dehydrogenase I, partial [Prevotella sp.]|nr:bifunctional aspartate kinase/homoserine dehydrogenase I [Prevotella sp.]